MAARKKTGARKPSKPSKTREIGKSGVEAELRRVAKEAGWFAPKFTSPANRSVPDRICFKGLAGAVSLVQVMFGLEEDAAEQLVRDIVREVVEMAECKAPGKKPTKPQERAHEMLHGFGINTVIIDGKEEARRYVRGK